MIARRDHTTLTVEHNFLRVTYRWNLAVVILHVDHNVHVDVVVVVVGHIIVIDVVAVVIVASVIVIVIVVEWKVRKRENNLRRRSNSFA